MPNRDHPKRPRPDGLGESSFSYAGELGIPPSDLKTIHDQDPNMAESLTDIHVAGTLSVEDIMKWTGLPTPEAAQQFLRESAAKDSAEAVQDSQDPTA
jgi:hypothetical protein